MIVHLNLSPELEDELHEEWGKDLERNVLEAVAAEFYRQGQCGTGTVRRMLGLEDRWDTIDFLGKRNLYPNYNEESAAQRIARYAQTFRRVRRSFLAFLPCFQAEFGFDFGRGSGFALHHAIEFPRRIDHNFALCVFGLDRALELFALGVHCLDFVVEVRRGRVEVRDLRHVETGGGEVRCRRRHKLQAPKHQLIITIW